jgi:hypothetical protein
MDKPIELQTASGSAELHIAPKEIDKQPLNPDSQLIAAVAANPSKKDDKQELFPRMTIEIMDKGPSESPLQSESKSKLRQRKLKKKCILSLPPRPPLIPPKQK